jgi:two-component system nitrogen regulation sensor histidine kinase NtrY
MKAAESTFSVPRQSSRVLSLRSRMRWLRTKFQSSWDGKLAVFMILLALVSGLATYAALNSALPFGGDSPDVVIWLLNIDLIIILALCALVARRTLVLFTIWRRGIPGARLHLQLVYIFGLLAMAPAIIMTLFSLFFFHYGIQTWFSDRVKAAVNESQAVAESYLKEHQQVIRADILAMANDLDRQAALYYTNPQTFERFVQTQSVLRNLSEVTIFDSTGQVLTEAGLTIMFDRDEVSDFAIEQANIGEVVLLTDEDDDRVRALVKLTSFTDAYLYVGRMVEANVLSHLSATREAVQKYDEVASRYAGLRVTVSMIYIVVALILLMTAIWFALVFARRLALPISSLIEAADKVRGGDLTARVPENSGLDEFDYLSRSFNRMTHQISDQQDELIDANRQMDQRRRFTETILAGVSSGVLGVDSQGKVNLANTSAGDILKLPAGALTGENIRDIFPEAREFIDQAWQRPNRIHEVEIGHTLSDGTRRTLFVRLVIELIGETDQGAVITFDDISNMQIAQRNAAWADVARRIAHEIKNPLTPIQLSAERLKRKYLNTIPEAEQAVFSQCIDTIVRHVGDIGTMVKEFSDFARMPEPSMQKISLSRVISDVVALNQQAHPAIAFKVNIAPNIITLCDEQQIRQAFTNLLQNAIDATLERIKKDGEGAMPGQIGVRLGVLEGRDIVISLTDTGMGLPKGRDPQSLTEPYVTFKEKGTGLGLAIVKKIMEDHKGRIEFGTGQAVASLEGWVDLGGATVSLIIPYQE